MLDEKDLQAIAQLMDQKLASQKTEIMGEIDTKMSSFKQETMAMMEAYFDPKFELLAEGQKTLLETLAPKNRVEQMDFDALQDYSSPAVPSEVLDKLEALDVETLTPIEALSLLYELSARAKEC